MSDKLEKVPINYLFGFFFVLFRMEYLIFLIFGFPRKPPAHIAVVSYFSVSARTKLSLTGRVQIKEIFFEKAAKSP